MEKNPEQDAFYFPNKIGRIILLSFEEVLGRNGVNALLNLAGDQHLINNYPPNTFDLNYSFETLGAFHQALDRMYGPRGGYGLAIRAGRACFKYGLREFGTGIGIGDLGFRLLPFNMKLKVGAQTLADTINQYTEQVVRIEEEPTVFRWKMERCPLCWGRDSDTPCCHLAVGMLQESLFWVSGGKNYLVEEESCIARGDDTCTICVDRQPLD